MEDIQKDKDYTAEFSAEPEQYSSYDLELEKRAL